VRVARTIAICAALLFGAAASAYADEGGAQPLSSAPEDTEARFLAFQTAGDKARARGDLIGATEAYLGALEIRKDPTVHGRLGLVTAQAHVWDAAAYHLLIALKRDGGTAAEKVELARAFAAVRPKVCLVHFEINVQGAQLEVDRRKFLSPGGYEEHFVSPGSHAARARADGYEEATAEFDAPVGGEMTVKLLLERPELPPADPTERIEVVEVPVEDAGDAPAFLPVVAPGFATPGPKPEEMPFRAEVALGPAVMLYGMPSVGVGGNGMIGLRWESFALAMDVRGVITPASGIGEEEALGRTLLWTGALLPCVSAKFLDACGVIAGSYMTFGVGAPITIRTADGFSFGFGARVAGRWQFSDRFALVGYGDVTMETRNVVVGSSASLAPEGPPDYWRSPQARITFGIALAATITP
jgi:hypothetical protein